MSVGGSSVEVESVGAGRSEQGPRMACGRSEGYTVDSGPGHDEVWYDRVADKVAQNCEKRYTG
jgi:hypothetical protein